MPLHSNISFAGLHKAKINSGLLTARPASPEGVGDMYWAYDDDGGNGAIYLTDALGTSWVKFSTSGGAINLDDLGDVSVPSPSDGQVLYWDNGTSLWKARDESADAANVTYSPSTPSDWNGSADPGNADDAFDQLASRTKIIEGDGGKILANSSDSTYDYLDQKLVQGANISIVPSGTTNQILTISATTGSSGLDDVRELAVARW
jgi:hypothetical protein